MICDDFGNPVAKMGVSEHGGTLGVHNKDGKTVVLMTVYKDDGGKAFFNKMVN